MPWFESNMSNKKSLEMKIISVLLTKVTFFLYLPSFFQASFENDSRIAFLTLLEYEPNEVREKIAEKTGTKPANAQAHEQSGRYKY